MNDRKQTPQKARRDLYGAVFPVGQIRLSALSVFNWGSFEGLHTAPIDPEGTLITGDNGAGKSTLIDGLMALLMPAGRATFNVAAAQGDRSDRTLLSYMRGSFGSAHDGAGTLVKSKRMGAVVTGLRACYRGDDGSLITLAVLFWTTQASNALADVKRIYMVARRDLALEEVLNAFGEGNARSLKQWLREDSMIDCYDENFSEYQARYQKLLYMDNKNAPALLARALGLKKIDDLTGLIRELVLEPSGVRDEAKSVVNEFADLASIHEQLSDARAQRNALERLPDFAQKRQQADERINQLVAEREGFPIYMADIQVQMWQTQIATLEAQRAALLIDIEDAKVKWADLELVVEGRHSAYIQAGGGRIEALEGDLRHCESTLARVSLLAANYQQVARDLGLSDQLMQAAFNDNQTQVTTALATLGQAQHQAQDHFAESAGQMSKLKQQLKGINEEIALIEARPNSNIDGGQQTMRDELISALGLSPEQCLFVGELLDVCDEASMWQGAIERALGGLRTTLLVPQADYSRVTKWLNARHTGLHVRVQVVSERKQQGFVDFHKEGFLRKLVWRDHPYRDWLKNFLQRFDLVCVDSTERLDATPFSLTMAGLIQREKGRFEKKDQTRIDDRHRWCLGFSNRSRLALLHHDADELHEAVKTSDQVVAEARRMLELHKQQEALWQKLAGFEWQEINAPYWHGQHAALSRELALLQATGSDLDQAREHWEAAKGACKKQQQQLQVLHQSEGQLQSTLTSAKVEEEKGLVLSRMPLDGALRQRLDARVAPHKMVDIEATHRVHAQLSQLIYDDLELWQSKKNSAEQGAIRVMTTFRAHEKWSVIALDWGIDLASMNDYIVHYQQLELEGLPQLVEQFVARLNQHATQSLARLHQRIESEREDIIERIDTINRVLVRTEFRQGSHLRLGAKIEHYPHVIAFKKQVSLVLAQATSEDHEARFNQLAQVVVILDKASSSATATTMESLRLLDPRHQLSFYAEELDTVTGEVLDVLESSSGKSGGEKESFAGMIVAASLAYVLTPEGCDQPVYCTVFLDEAFSNTAEAVSRRVLRVFKELNIHVNLITPYKNLNLARESARSLLIAERNAEQHTSQLCEVTWAEVDRQLAAKAATTINALDLGIVVGAHHGEPS